MIQSFHAFFFDEYFISLLILDTFGYKLLLDLMKYTSNVNQWDRISERHSFNGFIQTMIICITFYAMIFLNVTICLCITIFQSFPFTKSELLIMETFLLVFYSLLKQFLLFNIVLPFYCNHLYLVHILFTGNFDEYISCKLFRHLIIIPKKF